MNYFLITIKSIRQKIQISFSALTIHDFVSILHILLKKPKLARNVCFYVWNAFFEIL